jgi:DNA (cytosine-5)-methyltransferase 1
MCAPIVVKRLKTVIKYSESNMLTHFSTFSGIGGLDLAAEWAGFRTVGQVEMKDFPYRVLCKHWPDVPKWRMIQDVNRESVRGSGIEDITVLSGGFPCQPFSTAGKQKGKDDDRYLWPEMLRLIKELRPHWIVGENVANIVNMALDEVQTDLENNDYSTRTFIVPACSVNAPHKRNRVFIIANSEDAGNNRDIGTLCTQVRGSGLGLLPEFEQSDNISFADIDDLQCNDGADRGEGVYGGPPRFEAGTGDQPLTDTNSEGLQGYGQYGQYRGEVPSPASPWKASWVEVAARLCRVDDGVPDRVDRLTALGNAVVPQVAYPIFKAIANIEGL